MTGRVLGEAWQIYKRRFGIMVFFSFVFSGLGYTLYLAGIFAINQATSGFTMDFISMAARLVQGMHIEDLIWKNPAAMSQGMGLSVPLMLILTLVAAGLVFAYSILAVPMGIGGLTVLSTGAPGPQTWRSVLNGIKQRYGKLLVTYLCHMVYGMVAGFAFMIVCSIAATIAAFAIPLMAMGSEAGIAAGVVMIILFLLIIIAALVVMNILAVFIMPAAVFDRQYNFQAVLLSIKMAWKHFFRVLWVQLVAVLCMGIATLLLLGVFFAIAWAGPNIPVYTTLWYACQLTLVWPFSVIVNGVLYRHIQDRDALKAEAV